MQHGCEEARGLAGRVTRRDLLRVGSLGALGLTLPDMLALEQAGAAPRNDVAGILLWLTGGPSQFDSFDPKPEAPGEVRGPFRPIATNVDGIRFTELFARTAKHAEKLAVLRSVYHNLDHHVLAQGWMTAGRVHDAVSYPPMGSVVAKLKPPDPYLLGPSWEQGFLLLRDYVSQMKGSWNLRYGQRLIYRAYHLQNNPTRKFRNSGELYELLNECFVPTTVPREPELPLPEPPKRQRRILSEAEKRRSLARRATSLAARLQTVGGEQDEHRAYKHYIADNPHLLGLWPPQRAHVEYKFPSGDRVDILFEEDGGRYTVVEVELKGKLQTVIGLYQCVKYRSLMKARLKLERADGTVAAILVAKSIPADVRRYAEELGVVTKVVPFRR